MGIINAIIKGVFIKTLKLFTPANFLGSGNPREEWVKEFKEEDGVIHIKIEAPSDMLTGWAIANWRSAVGEIDSGFLDLQDAIDILDLDKVPAPEEG